MRWKVFATVFLAAAWAALGFVKLQSLVVVDKPRVPPLQTFAAIGEVAVAVLVLVPGTRRIGLRISALVAALLLFVSIVQLPFLHELDKKCQCLGPSIDATRATRRFLSALLFLWSVLVSSASREVSMSASPQPPVGG